MMLPESAQHKVIEEIELFIEYGVTASERATAKTLVRKYHNSPVALAVLLEFYKVLPEEREEAVVRISRIDALQGVMLLVVSTDKHNYSVVVSDDDVQILGEFGIEQIPEDVLRYFGHENNEMFMESCSPVVDLPEYALDHNAQTCPLCQVAVGELHLLGCLAEICPWCDGQLSKCNCRFEKLKVESFENEEQLEEFQELLEVQGRVPFTPEHKPGYPGTSKGLDV